MDWCKPHHLHFWEHSAAPLSQLNSMDCVNKQQLQTFLGSLATKHPESQNWKQNKETGIILPFVYTSSHLPHKKERSENILLPTQNMMRVPDQLEQAVSPERSTGLTLQRVHSAFMNIFAKGKKKRKKSMITSPRVHANVDAFSSIWLTNKKNLTQPARSDKSIQVKEKGQVKRKYKIHIQHVFRTRSVGICQQYTSAYCGAKCRNVTAKKMPQIRK